MLTNRMLVIGLTGESERSYSIETSTNLSDWVARPSFYLGNTNSGRFEAGSYSAPLAPARFFRAKTMP